MDYLMKQEMTAPEATENRTGNKTRVMGINWVDSKKPGEVSIKVLDRMKASRPEHKSVRENGWQSFMLPTPRNFASFGYRIGLYVLYCVGSFGRAMGLQRNHRLRWKNPRRSVRLMGLALLSALTMEFVGCVGYVGPDGGEVVGPVVETPGVFVVGGGYHGHYAGDWGHRGAVSRGWHR